MIDSGERADFYHTAYRTAKKPHKCDECSRPILAKERYQRTFMAYDGYSSTFVTCAHCSVAIDWLTRNCGGAMHGAVWRDIEEHTFEYRNLAFGLLRLCVGQRRQWMRFDGTELMAVPKEPKGIEHVVAEYYRS